MKSTVYVHIENDGIPLYYVAGDVDVIVIDDRTPHDRVFQVSRHSPPQELLESIKDEYIGHAGDARQKKLVADLGGKSHLAEV